METDQKPEAPVSAGGSSTLRTFVIVVLPLIFVTSAAAIRPGWLTALSDAGAAAVSDAVEPSAAEPTESGTPAESTDSEDTIPLILFSVDTTVRLANDLTISNEDIVCCDGSEIWMVFDGSDVGLSGHKISSFTLVGPQQILMTFSEPVQLSGISRAVRPTDIVSFQVSQLGTDTDGTFELHFAGENVGLSSAGEHIDALHRFPDGRMVMSTVSSHSVPGAEGHDEDLIVFSPAAFGNETAGTWDSYLDGSDVEWSGQDVDAVSLDEEGHIYLSSHDRFSPAIGPVAANDILLFRPTSLGRETTGTYEPQPVLNGRQMKLGTCNIKGLDIAVGIKRAAVTAAYPKRSETETAESPDRSDIRNSSGRGD